MTIITNSYYYYYYQLRLVLVVFRKQDELIKLGTHANVRL